MVRWLEALPEEFCARLPRVKIAVAARLRTPAGGPAHAASFIPQRYLLLDTPLFSPRRRGELGRILYHELCHFLWPRLGRRRLIYEAAIAREIRNGVAGELGHSAALAKTALNRQMIRTRHSNWRHYLCESFCDTGAYLLLRNSGYRPSRHSEWTLAPRVRRERLGAWRLAAGLGAPGKGRR